MKKKKFKLSSRMLTVLLFVVLVFFSSAIWSVFISGPSRVHEESVNYTIQLIKKNNKDVKGLTRHVFEYVTYNGYSNDTLYWFDDNGDSITKREIYNLDYDKAKKVAKEEYGIECDSIVLGYGYNNPCYEIRGSGKLIMIDFDTFVQVYERGNRYG